jgi:GNAT superfamily N-acetyltransferase
MQIRRATPDDVDDVITIEVEAGALFLTVGMPEVAADVPARQPLTLGVAQGRLWVADDDGRASGFVLASVVDGQAHIDQVCVRPSNGRRGIGRQLVGHVERWGRERGLPGTTLTTFRDVPWNGPYYRSLGYTELPADAVGPELAAIVAHEASLPGLDPALRCAMLKRNAGRGQQGGPGAQA